MGGVSPLLFIAAFSLAPNPGRYRVICMPCFGLHPQGFAVSSVMSVSAQQECIITQDIPYRFWSIAVILTTPVMQGCVPGWWGDFPQLRKNRYRRPHSPSHILINIEREKEYVKNTAWESNSIRLRDGYCPINRHLFIEIS